MSYARTRYPRHRSLRRQGMGDVAGVISDVASTAANVANDPCLGQVEAYVGQIYGATSSSGPSTSTGPGIGLCSVVTPLSYVAYAVNNKAIVAIMGVSFLGLLVGIGYALGSD